MTMHVCRRIRVWTSNTVYASTYRFTRNIKHRTIIKYRLGTGRFFTEQRSYCTSWTSVFTFVFIFWGINLCPKYLQVIIIIFALMYNRFSTFELFLHWSKNLQQNWLEAVWQIYILFKIGTVLNMNEYEYICFLKNKIIIYLSRS